MVLTFVGDEWAIYREAVWSRIGMVQNPIWFSSEAISCEPLIVSVFLEDLAYFLHSCFVLINTIYFGPWLRNEMQMLLLIIVTRRVVNSHAHIDSPATFYVFLKTVFLFPHHLFKRDEWLSSSAFLVVQHNFKRFWFLTVLTLEELLLQEIVSSGEKAIHSMSTVILIMLHDPKPE